ncbi:uncharacterized protein LOC142638053 [Castanea sativa]|uniref:uncharacterized protein LOC142638053 n=1 Tax=Castanea sativa TaxID=21020 RepID=UPI003F64A3D2
MASLAKHLSFFFLLVLFSSLQIQARESRFFSKFTHDNANYNMPVLKVSLTAEAPTPTPEPTLTPAPAPAIEPVTAQTPEVTPEPTYSESENGYGYGLYGHASNQFPPTKETPTTTTTNFEDENLSEELTGERYKTGYPKTNLYNYNSNPNNYNNNGNPNNYNNGFSSSYSSNNGYTTNYNSNGYANNYNTNGYYNSNGYQSERQGMSDTRFMENGKYYFEVQNVNTNLNGYESGRGTAKNEGYYGNNMYPNEFNTMEEYEKQEESQKEFVP